MHVVIVILKQNHIKNANNGKVIMVVRMAIALLYILVLSLTDTSIQNKNQKTQTITGYTPPI